ncbi:hypothetical protein, partial [Luteimonas sp. A478]
PTLDFFFHHHAHGCLLRKVTPEQEITGSLHERLVCKTHQTSAAEAERRVQAAIEAADESRRCADQDLTEASELIEDLNSQLLLERESKDALSQALEDSKGEAKELEIKLARIDEQLVSEREQTQRLASELAAMEGAQVEFGRLQGEIHALTEKNAILIGKLQPSDG